MASPNQLARAVAAALTFAVGTASAGQLDYNLYAGAEQSDNINLASQHPVSQSVLIPGLNFVYDQQGADLKAHVLGNLEYRNYPGGKFNDQTQLELAGQAAWTLAPERLDLTVQDYAGVQPLDTLASNAPGNQQQTNVFAIGPVVHFRLGDSLRGQGELRYIDSHAEKTHQFDSRRGQAALRVLKDLSPAEQLSFNLDTERVDLYNDATTSNYSRHELFGRYTSKLAHFDLDVALGASQIDFDRADTHTQSSPLARVSADWRASQRSTFTLSATRQYADAAQDMMLRPGEAALGNTHGINTGDAVVSSQVYLERTLELTYALHTERLTLSVSPRYRKLGYSGDTTFDQSGRGGNLAIDFRLRPALTLSAFAEDETLSYQTLDRRDRTLIAGIGLTDQWTRHWSWRASLLHQRRNSNVADQGFHENQIYFGVVYKR